MKKYINPILNITTITLLFYTVYSLHNDVKEIPVLQQRVDSLQGELFILQTEAMRHEITREQILTKYPDVYEEYNNYLSTETE